MKTKLLVALPFLTMYAVFLTYLPAVQNFTWIMGAAIFFGAAIFTVIWFAIDVIWYIDQWVSLYIDTDKLGVIVIGIFILFLGMIIAGGIWGPEFSESMWNLENDISALHKTLPHDLLKDNTGLLLATIGLTIETTFIMRWLNHVRRS